MSKIQRDFQQRTERSDPDEKTGGPPRVGACPGHTHERGDITAEVRTNGDHDHAAGTGRRRQGLVQVQGPNTVIIAEVAVRAGSERKGVRKCAERAEAGWREQRNYRSRRRRKCLRNSSSNSRR